MPTYHTQSRSKFVPNTHPLCRSWCIQEAANPQLAAVAHASQLVHGWNASTPPRHPYSTPFKLCVVASDTPEYRNGQPVSAHFVSLTIHSRASGELSYEIGDCVHERIVPCTLRVHEFETGLHDHIEDRPLRSVPREEQKIRFHLSYQGECEYSAPDGRRLRFRWSRVPWRWSFQKEGERYWNYDNRDQFEKEVNGNHGLLSEGSEPVDEETLRCFQGEHCVSARTGYFCHHRKAWIFCRPTKRRPSEASWRQRRSIAP